MGVGGFFTSKLDEAIGWARKYSIFQYPFVTACCGMEYMATACSHYDIDRYLAPDIAAMTEAVRGGVIAAHAPALRIPGVE